MSSSKNISNILFKLLKALGYISIAVAVVVFIVGVAVMFFSDGTLGTYLTNYIANIFKEDYLTYHRAKKLLYSVGAFDNISSIIDIDMTARVFLEWIVQKSINVVIVLFAYGIFNVFLADCGKKEAEKASNPLTIAIVAIVAEIAFILFLCQIGISGVVLCIAVARCAKAMYDSKASFREARKSTKNIWRSAPSASRMTHGTAGAAKSANRALKNILQGSQSSSTADTERMQGNTPQGAKAAQPSRRQPQISRYSTPIQRKCKLNGVEIDEIKGEHSHGKDKSIFGWFDSSKRSEDDL